MKRRSTLAYIGVLIYVLSMVMERFLFDMPDALSIALAVVAALFIIAGFVRRNRGR